MIAKEYFFPAETDSDNTWEIIFILFFLLQSLSIWSQCLVGSTLMWDQQQHLFWNVKSWSCAQAEDRWQRFFSVYLPFVLSWPDLYWWSSQTQTTQMFLKAYPLEKNKIGIVRNANIILVLRGFPWVIQLCAWIPYGDLTGKVRALVVLSMGTSPDLLLWKGELGRTSMKIPPKSFNVKQIVTPEQSQLLSLMS